MGRLSDNSVMRDIGYVPRDSETENGIRRLLEGERKSNPGRSCVEREVESGGTFNLEGVSPDVLNRAKLYLFSEYFNQELSDLEIRRSLGILNNEIGVNLPPGRSFLKGAELRAYFEDVRRAVNSAGQ